MIVIDPPGDGDLAERRGKAKVLKLIDRAKVIGDIGNDIADREVGIAFLGEGRTAVVGVACVLGGQGDERVGQLTLDVLEVIVGGRELEVEVAVDFPVSSKLPRIKILIVAGKLIGAIGSKVKVGVEDR